MGAAIGNSQGLLRLTEGWQPFLARIDPIQFQLLENRLNMHLSEQAEVVLYNVSEKKLTRSLALKRVDGNHYRLDIDYHGTETHESWMTKKSLLIPADAAGRFLAALHLALTKQVYPIAQGSESLDDSTSRTKIWMQRRCSESVLMAGYVEIPSYGDRCLVGENRSFLAFWELVHSLAKCARPDGAPLVDLDLEISRFKASYPDN